MTVSEPSEPSPLMWRRDGDRGPDRDGKEFGGFGVAVDLFGFGWAPPERGLIRMIRCKALISLIACMSPFALWRALGIGLRPGTCFGRGLLGRLDLDIPPRVRMGLQEGARGELASPYFQFRSAAHV